ncbi:hypothetical protein [Shewanella sp.]|uniref:hypothetical protein n=1 Tax=Shewanella sp. TaxID=50422 RepID=UPI003568A0D8
MSVIANFKKRRAQRKDTSEAATTPAPENEALVLLASLLGCEQTKAIDKAKYFVNHFIETDRDPALKIAFLTDGELKKAFHMVSVDPSNGDDKTVITQITTDDAGNITDITESVNDAADSVNQASDSVNNAADSVSDAANEIDQSASNINDSASDLAYSVDSIASAANDIKEATSELKKPSAAPKSSRSKKAAAPKKNSKK